MRSYTVISGDSLSEISQKFFGDFSQVNAIAQVNHITDKDVIFPGQVLQIPDTPAAADPSDGSAWMWWLLAGGAGIAAYLVYKRHRTKKKATRAIK